MYKYLLVIVLVLLCSCQDHENSRQLNDKAENQNYGLLKLHNQWIEDSSFFVVVYNDDIKYVTYDKLLSKDDVRFININYHLNVDDSLWINKEILIDYETYDRLYEKDIYTRKLNAHLESSLNISYDYEDNKFECYYTEEKGSLAKRIANQEKANRLMAESKEKGFYLCGTSYFGILFEDIPKFVMPKPIGIDSAILILDKWKVNDKYEQLTRCCNNK